MALRHQLSLGVPFQGVDATLRPLSASGQIDEWPSDLARVAIHQISRQLADFDTYRPSAIHVVVRQELRIWR